MPSPQYDSLVQLLRSRPRLADFSIAEQRVLFDELTSQFPLLDNTRCEPVNLGAVAGEWVAARDSLEDRIIYYLHGGGYAIGSLNSHRALVSRLSSAAGARCLMVDYRLAPEHQFPTAVDDAVAGYRWLLSTGVPSSRIVIAGDSGGGGLTMATLLALRDFGEPRPAAAVCMSPWVDLTCEGASLRQRADTDPVVTRQWLVTLAEAYLGGADAREPYASPVYADLAGLPPLLLQVGSAEILLDEIQELARRSEAAGVNVTLDVWDGMFHFWQAFASMLPEGQQALDRGGSFVAETVPDLAQPRS